ncbi:MAG: hypothetical protein WCG73_00545, partial [Candidatus Moraniibacteriota bacterium]
GKGTFLFWYFPQGSKRRIALRREGRELVSVDSVHRILLEPENIKTLIEQMELIPSTMLSLSILHCYYGVKCLGGFSQVNYLAYIEKAWNKIFHEECFDEIMEKSPLQALCGDFIIGLLQTKERLVPATTLDFLLYESVETFDIFKKTTAIVTVAESMMLVFPELYTILYTPEERKKSLEKINRDTIFELLKLKNKMLPCIIQDTL